MRPFLIFFCFLVACDMPPCYIHGLSNTQAYDLKDELIDCPMCSEQEKKNIDSAINKMFNCIIEVMQEPLPEEYVGWGKCPTQQYDLGRVCRDCVKIKAVPAEYSMCSEWGFVGEPVDTKLCSAKSDYNPACPCRYRNLVQEEHWLVTPYPNLYLWDAVTIFTGCTNIWDSPFTKCIGNWGPKGLVDWNLNQ